MKTTSRIVRVDRTTVCTGVNALGKLHAVCKPFLTGKNKVFILTDSNTFQNCLPRLLESNPWLDKSIFLTVDAGEGSKTLQTVARLWGEMLSCQADRDSLMITLGGGMITDLGGFVAGGYKRGITCIHIPTTLLAQVDAAIGGKTAVNLEGIKNQAGFFFLPAAVISDPCFLTTLPPRHLKSGLAEIIKTTLTGNAVLWKKLKNKNVEELLLLPPESPFWQHLINGAITYKNRIVQDDFNEKQSRSILNFGHTIGHAVESFSQTEGAYTLLHGEAVAAGMIGAVWLSSKKSGLTPDERDQIADFLFKGYGPFPFTHGDIPSLIDKMAHDKKNRNGEIRFTLISKPGSPRINMSCQPGEIAQALDFCLRF
jgi:3-dehydroquinate synthase